MPQPANSNFRLAPARRRWLNQQIQTGRFNDLTEAIDFHLREAARLEAVRHDFEKSIEDAEKGPYERADEAWWADLRREAITRHKTRARRKSA